jgi:hypothetical protein
MGQIPENLGNYGKGISSRESNDKSWRNWLSREFEVYRGLAIRIAG